MLLFHLQLFGIDKVINTARTFLGCDDLDFGEASAWLKEAQYNDCHQSQWRSLKGRALDLKVA